MFNIMKNKWYFMGVSILIVLIGIVAYFINGGFVYDIDFVGGTTMQVNMENTFDNGKLEAEVKKSIGTAPYSVQKVDNGNSALIKMKSLDSAAREKLFKDIKTTFNLKTDAPLSVDNVTPSVGDELRGRAILSVLIACALILLFITIRFDFLSGTAAIIALVHDVLIMTAVYALFKIPVNSSFIAASLTVVGYSIYDTVIVFDRVRENKRYIRKESFANIAEMSIWQTMVRSLNTTGVAVLVLVVLYIMGVSSIKEFAFPLIIGTASGAYSSIFIAAPIWVLLRGEKKSGAQKI